MKVTYSGHRTLWFPDYIDLATGQTLAAEPGCTYNIEPVGYNAPSYPVDGFTPAGDENEPEDEFTFAAPEMEE